MRNSVRLIAAILVVSALGVVSPSAQQREGIKVHGDWMVEVRNPDGSLAQRHEFKNALVGGGPLVLSRLLTRSGSVGSWLAYLGGDQVDDICRSLDSRASCVSTEIGVIHPNDADRIFPTLQVAYPPTPTGPDASKVQLSGSVTASFNGTIRRVGTNLSSCTPDTPPSQCSVGAGAFAFTERILDAPIAVVAGQIVQFKVILSFS